MVTNKVKAEFMPWEKIPFLDRISRLRDMQGEGQAGCCGSGTRMQPVMGGLPPGCMGWGGTPGDRSLESFPPARKKQISRDLGSTEYCWHVG